MSLGEYNSTTVVANIKLGITRGKINPKVRTFLNGISVFSTTQAEKTATIHEIIETRKIIETVRKKTKNTFLVSIMLKKLTPAISNDLKSKYRAGVIHNKAMAKVSIINKVGGLLLLYNSMFLFNYFDS